MSLRRHRRERPLGVQVEGQRWAARFAAMALMACASLAAQAAGYGYSDISHMNCVEANDTLNRGMAAGDAEAAYTASQLVIRRVCFKRDLPAYVELLRKAVDGGHRPALEELAYATALGEAVVQDYAKAGALWRQADAGQSSSLDDYTFGVAMTLARLTRRFVNTPPARWDFSHRLEVRLEFAPAMLERMQMNLARRGDLPPGSQAEAARAIEVVQRDVEDAWRQALRKSPPVDAKRLGDGTFKVGWTMVVQPSVEANQLPLDRLEELLAR
jgi:hypothetical protein